MRAVLLAAGRGKRLGIDGPKCLLPIGGRSLLERHLDCMVGAGIGELTIVTGFRRELLESALHELVRARARAGRPLVLEIECLFNERHAHGSLVSLACAIDRIAEGGIWMDADVLYPSALLGRLAHSAHPNCVLLDARAAETGEEMMLAARGGRVHRIARRVGAGWDVVGESVGFFKVDRVGARVMAGVLGEEVAAGRLDQEHEDGLNRALELADFGYELVDLPWTEIDFPADVERAESLLSSIEQSSP
jgi:choline kinase